VNFQLKKLSAISSQPKKRRKRKKPGFEIAPSPFLAES
jgi:hypothetical protein